MPRADRVRHLCAAAAGVGFMMLAWSARGTDCATPGFESLRVELSEREVDGVAQSVPAGITATVSGQAVEVSDATGRIFERPFGLQHDPGCPTKPPTTAGDCAAGLVCTYAQPPQCTQVICGPSGVVREWPCGVAPLIARR